MSLTAHRAPQAEEEPGRLGREILPTVLRLSMAMCGKLKNTYCRQAGSQIGHTGQMVLDETEGVRVGCRSRQ